MPVLRSIPIQGREEELHGSSRVEVLTNNHLFKVLHFGLESRSAGINSTVSETKSSSRSTAFRDPAKAYLWKCENSGRLGIAPLSVRNCLLERGFTKLIEP